MCSSNPIIALTCSSPVCFAFEITGSSSLCSYTTSSNRVPFVRKSPALLAVLSLAVRQETAAQCTDSSLPPSPCFSPPVKTGSLGDHYLTYEDTNSIIYIFQHLQDIPLCVIRQPLVSAGFPLDAWLCMALGKAPPQQQSKTALISLACILAESVLLDCPRGKTLQNKSLKEKLRTQEKEDDAEALF